MGSAARWWRRGAAVIVLGLAGMAAVPAPRRGAAAPPVMAERGRAAARAATYRLAVPTGELVQLLRAEVFTDSGRFYPCRTNPSCSSWGQDIALSRPSVSIEGQRIAFAVHLNGSYPINQFFTPTVAGDLVVSGVPVVRDNKVALSQAQATSTPSSDMAFRAFVEATHTRIEQMLEESTGFDLPGYLAYSTSDPQAPPPRLPTGHCADPHAIQVQSVRTEPAASAVSAVVAVAEACR